MNKKIYRFFTISLWAIPLAFYLFFWMYDGAVWCADTESYVLMRQNREPLYPLYLALLRMIFGSETTVPFHDGQLMYLFVAVLGQSLLAAYACYSLCRYISKRFELGMIASYAVLFMPMATSLLCRFAAKRASMYSNSILTEGVAISIYLLFIRYCAELILDRTRSSYFKCAAILVIAILLRKQMYILLALFVIAVIITEKKEGVVRLVISVVSILMLTRLIDCSYNLVMYHHFMGHTDDNRFVTTMAFYVSERDDVQYVDHRIQDIFLQTYDICEENGWLMHSAPEGWLASEEFFANNYDHIQIETMQVTILDAVNHTDTDYSWLGEGDKADLIRAELNRSLIPHRIPRLMKTIFYNYLAGLITSIAVKNRILNIYALVMYLIYIILFIALLCKARKEDSNRIRYYDAMKLGGLVMISILGNVALVSSVIFTQTRYTIYNMPLFYIGLVVMMTTIRAARRGGPFDYIV